MQQPESKEAPVGLIVGVTLPLLIIVSVAIAVLCRWTRHRQQEEAATAAAMRRPAHLHTNPAFNRPGAVDAEGVYLEPVSTQPALYDAAAEYAEVQDRVGTGGGGILSTSSAIYSAVIDPSVTYTPLAVGKSTYAGVAEVAQFNSEA